MYPKLFELGPATVYTYGVLLAAAYLAGLKLAMVRAKARGLDANRVLDLGIYIRKAGLPLWTTTDVFAPGIALGHVVGRFGCLFAGCCYGKQVSAPHWWTVTFTDPFAAVNVGTPLNVPLYPTQLFEAGAE